MIRKPRFGNRISRFGNRSAWFGNRELETGQLAASTLPVSQGLRVGLGAPALRFGRGALAFRLGLGLALRLCLGALVLRY